MKFCVHCLLQEDTSRGYCSVVQSVTRTWWTRELAELSDTSDNYFKVINGYMAIDFTGKNATLL